MQEGYVSLRSFGRDHDVRLSAVQKAIASGRVTDVLRSERGDLVGIHLVNGWAQWQRNTDPGEAAKSGKVYDPIECSAQASTPGVQNNASRASPSGVVGQGGDTLSNAVTDPDSPATPSASRSEAEQSNQLRSAAAIEQLHELTGSDTQADSETYEGALSVGEKRSATNSEQMNLATTAGDLANASSQEGAGRPVAAEPGYSEHRAKREKFLAETAELEYLKLVGTLVSATTVEREVEELFLSVKAKLMRFVPKKSAVLAAETDPARLERLLTDSINQALNESSSALADPASVGLEGRAPALS